MANLNVSVSGDTITVQANNCNDYGGATLSPAPSPPITPSATTSGSVTTITFSGVPSGTYTVTVTCGKTNFTTPPVTIP